MKIDNEKLDALIKGALLHDIGKVCERALGNFNNHANDGVDFLDEVLKGYSYNEQKKEIITNCMKLHHEDDNIKNDMAKIICNADTYASKIDRREGTEGVLEKDYKEDYVKNAYRYLRSIFNRFNKEESLSNTKHPLYNLDKRFKFKKINNESEIEITKGTYTKAYENIKNKFIKNNILDIKLNRLLDILEDELSLIPSDTKKSYVCDNSLFSHSKLTAAIVNCMSQYKGYDFKDEESILLIAYKLNNIKEHSCNQEKGALQK